MGIMLFLVKNCWTLSVVWAGALINHPSWNGQISWKSLQKNPLKPNAASHNTTSWYTDTDGFLEHSSRGGSLYYKGPALQKIILSFGGSPLVDMIVITSVSFPSPFPRGWGSYKLQASNCGFVSLVTSTFPEAIWEPAKSRLNGTTTRTKTPIGLHYRSKRISSMFGISLLCRLQILFKYSSFFRKDQSRWHMFSSGMAWIRTPFLKHKVKGWLTSPGLLQLLFNTSNLQSWKLGSPQKGQ